MDKKEESNVLGFNCFITDQNERHYGCRGIGKDYDEFYNNFLDGKSYECTSENFPWDYFIFTNIHDEQSFLAKYSDKIFFMLPEDRD